jgi:predicted enzyme related to lactoylglutathione lyase
MSDRANHHFGLVLDCADPQRLAAFWAAALDYVNVGSAGAYVALYPRDGHGPKLLLQQVPHAKTTKNRMHIGFDAADIEAEAERLTRIGAHRATETSCHEHGNNWIVMADPEGNEFCICDGGNPGSHPGASPA